MSTERKIEHLPLTALRPDPRNPKAHSVKTIDASVGRFGFVEPIIVDERTGYIISGHGRTKTLSAMALRGESPPEGVLTDAATNGWLVPVVTGWASRTDSEASAALIALNRTTELGGWVDDALLSMLDDLSAEDDGLLGVGYGDDDIAALREKLDSIASEEESDGEGGGDGDSDRAPSTGEMLALADVAWGEPDHKVTHGEVWRIGHHVLVVAKVHDEHALWLPLLIAAGSDAIFAPYPEPYITTGTLAQEHPMVFVQPNAYLAGHLMDKFASVFPDQTIERTAP